MEELPITEVLLLFQSDDESIRSKAQETILAWQTVNPILFLQVLFLYLSKSDHSSTSTDLLAIILAYRTIYISKNEIFLEDNRQLFSNYLTLSSSYFLSTENTIRINSAKLFSSIFLNDQMNGNQYQSLQYFYNLVMNPPSSLIIHPILIIISDYCESELIDQSFISLILNSLNQFFGFEDSKVSCFCLEIISTLLPYMGEFGESEIGELFNLIIQFCNNENCRIQAFDTLTVLSQNFYPYFHLFLPILTSDAFINVVSYNDVSFLVAYLRFWNSIAENETASNCDFSIIQTRFDVLIPLFLNAASIHQSQVYSGIESSDILATEILNEISSIYLEQLQQIYVSYIKQFNSSESYSEREVSISLICFLLKYSEENDFNESLLDNFYHIIYKGLHDQIPRVRQNSIYCIEAFYDVSVAKIEQKLELLQILIMKLKNDEEVFEDSTTVVSRFFALPDFPYFNEACSSLLELGFATDLNISTLAFNSMFEYVKNANVDHLLPFLFSCLAIFESVTFSNEHYLFYMIDLLTELICKLGVNINDNSFDKIWSILTATANKYPHQTVLPISALSKTNNPKYSQLLPTILVNLILPGIQTEDFNPSLTGLKIIFNSIDFTPFVSILSEILPILMIILNNQDIPVSSKRMVIECLDALNKAIPELFAQNTPIILPIVCELTQQLNDWEDFNTNSSFMRFLNTVMANEHVELENKALSCKTFFLLMSLVIIRANIDIYYADSVIDGLFTINKLFPDQLNEFLVTNSSLKFILHEFLHIDGIDLIKLGQIIEVISS